MNHPTVALRITVEDLKTGETSTQEMLEDDYFILTTGRCEVAGIQTYPTKGTHVITVKGQRARRDRLSDGRAS